jgi:hypothetical protein
LVLAAPQLLAKLAIDQVRGIRRGSTHTSNTAPAQAHHSSCTIYQQQNLFLQIINHTHPAKPWRPSEAQDQARRRGTSSSSQEEKDKLKPGASQEVKDKQQPIQEEKASLKQANTNSKQSCTQHHYCTTSG